MHQDNLQISVIIVNWNTRDILRDCLRSVYEQTKDISFEVIVIDNASSDGPAAMVREEFPQVILIENADNSGFAAANNQGMTITKGRYVLLLNPDTIVLDKALGKKRGVYAFRPPYGKLNLFCLLYLWAREVPICYWTLVSSDTWSRDKQNTQRISSLASETGGAVVLTHDFDRTNDDVDNMVIESTRLCLCTAKERGINVLTLSQLLSNYNK